MNAGACRHISNVIFWILLSVGLIALACGWISVHPSLEDRTRNHLHNLHISFGLIGAILIVIQLLTAITLIALDRTRGSVSWRGVLSIVLRQLAYLSFLALIVTGASASLYRGEQILFFGFPLPYLEELEPEKFGSLHAAHPFAAYIFAGAIFANLTAAAISLLFRKRQPILPAPVPPPTSIQSTIADGLVQNFRLFGRIAFWVQFIIALLSAPLLAFSFVGHTVSPSHTFLGDTIYWAAGGLALLLISVSLVSFRTRVANAIRATPARYLGSKSRMPFWFLGVAAFISIVGALISFVGVGLSVAYLIGKTVSQPPGIAITDPSKIIRALDVFVLLVNVNLLFAHFVGFAITAWLSSYAWRAHHQYGLSTEPATREAPQISSGN